MQIKINSLIKTSFVDFPDKISAVIFTQGCNFKCPYCHNPQLISFNSQSNILPDEIISFLEKRKNILDGVVICGGEPTLQKDLPFFLKAIKNIGYNIKLDTNGSNPQMLSELISQKLIDYVAMDLKVSFDKYSTVVQYKSIKNIKQSLFLLQNSQLPHEIRTTTVKPIHTKEDLITIGNLCKGSTFILQSFKNGVLLDKQFSKTAEAFNYKDLKVIANHFNHNKHRCIIR